MTILAAVRRGIVSYVGRYPVEVSPGVQTCTHSLKPYRSIGNKVKNKGHWWVGNFRSCLLSHAYGCDRSDWVAVHCIGVCLPAERGAGKSD